MEHGNDTSRIDHYSQIRATALTPSGNWNLGCHRPLPDRRPHTHKGGDQAFRTVDAFTTGARASKCSSTRGRTGIHLLASRNASLKDEVAFGDLTVHVDPQIRGSVAVVVERNDRAVVLSIVGHGR